MTKYRMCGGFAMTPKRDMKMLSKMSKKGWHLSKMQGIFYCFEKGEPHDYNYSLNLEISTTPEMLSFYEASGWTPIVVENGHQIFRAESGTAPIFSDAESEIEVLNKNRHWSGKYALLFAALITICVILSSLIESIIFAILSLIVFVLFIFTFLPYIGFTFSLYKLKHK
jgi:hypothetical protein